MMDDEQAKKKEEIEKDLSIYLFTHLDWLVSWPVSTSR